MRANELLSSANPQSVSGIRFYGMGKEPAVEIFSTQGKRHPLPIIVRGHKGICGPHRICKKLKSQLGGQATTPACWPVYATERSSCLETVAVNPVLFVTQNH